MITSSGKLVLLEDFQYDWDLPKFKRPDDEEISDAENSFGQSKSARGRHSTTFSQGVSFSVDNQRALVTVMEAMGAATITKGPEPPTGFQKFFGKFKPKPKPAAKAPEPILMSIEEFFVSIKNSASELEIVKGRAEGYERAIMNAKKSGQNALLEQLEGGLNAYRMETQCLAIGLTKFVGEADIVKFYKESKKGLRLDLVRNFARPIPAELVTKKVRADEIGIFDNYVVLHYDPQAKSYAETEAEREAKKDPILFGLMKGSRKLYVIGDWVDELCDLTLEQLADALGKSAVQELK